MSLSAGASDVNETAKDTPGWYGKIPSLGDFASRRLPTPFIALWDEWLQTSIAGSSGRLGEAWLETYLNCPLWRFMLMPGVCGATAWSGVLMPSVDKVGRYFPLTLCCELPRLPASADELAAVLAWLEELEQPALAALDTQHTPQQLEAALNARPLPPFASDDEARRTLGARLAACLRADTSAAATLALPAAETIAPLLASAAAQTLADACHGNSLWWAHGAPDADTVLLCCRGLPDCDAFTRMLQGGGSAVH